MVPASSIVLRISGSEFPAADPESVFAWINEGRVPDDCTVRMDGAASWSNISDACLQWLRRDTAAPEVQRVQNATLRFPSVESNAYRLLGIPGSATLDDVRDAESRSR